MTQPSRPPCDPDLDLDLDTDLEPSPIRLDSSDSRVEVLGAVNWLTCRLEPALAPLNDSPAPGRNLWSFSSSSRRCTVISRVCTMVISRVSFTSLADSASLR